jgi:hypothetical protein
MKRTLIAVSLAALGMAANAVHADPTIFSSPGEDTMQAWKKAPEATSYRPAEVRPELHEVQEGIYSFNP